MIRQIQTANPSPRCLAQRFVIGFRITLLYCLLALATTSCVPELYTGKIVGSGRPGIQKDANGVLFSMIVRKLNYANSNGLNWIARRDDDDYRALYRDITKLMTEELRMQPVERTRVLDHTLYQEGRFPLAKKYYLNTSRLPIISNAEEEELMLRSSRALGSRYFITVLADHSVSKVVALPATITSVLIFNLYSADSGLIYQANLEISQNAEPYDRSLGLGELYRQYESVLADRADHNIEILLKELRAKVAEEIRFVENPPRQFGDESGDAPDNDLGF